MDLETPEPERRDQQIAMVTNDQLRALIQSCVEIEPELRPDMETIIDGLAVKSLKEVCIFLYHSLYRR